MVKSVRMTQHGPGKARHPSHPPAHPAAAHHAPAHTHEAPLHRQPVVALFVFLFVGLLAWRGVHEPGTWIHVKTGERIMSAGALPETDPFSYSAAGKDWTTESWLGDVLFARVHEEFPRRGLKALKSVAAACAFTLMLPLNHGHPLLAGAVLCLGAAACWPQFTELPGIFDLLMLAALIRLLRGRGRFTWTLAWAAALECLWANLSGSASLLGVWLVSLKAIKAAGRTDHKDLPRFLAVLGLVAAGWLANPHGWNLLPYLSRGAFAPEPVWQVGGPFTLYGAFVLAGAWASWICLQSEFYLSMTSASLLGLSLLFPGLRAAAVLAACPTLSLALAHFVSRRDATLSRAVRWALVPALLLAWHWRFVRMPYGGAAGYGVFDVDGAAHYLKAQGVRGKMFNDLALGDYLVGAGRPVFVDSRRGLYDEDVLRDGGEWPARWKSLVDKVYRFDYAVIRNLRAAYPARVLDEDPDWRLAYADDLSLVYLRRSGANAWLVQNTAKPLLRPNKLWPDSMDVLLKNPRQVPKLLEELDRWIVACPDSVQALLWKAYALDRLNLSEKGERFLELALGRRRVDTDAELSALCGFVLESRGQKGSARRAYWRSVLLARGFKAQGLEAAVLRRLVGLNREWGYKSLVRELEARIEALEK
ncbi:MAG: hypothetical protein HY748_08745 [Elusimicrobia bacterium]|nr:hypothetical protein [Elusimicrobiota bacterium]